MLTFNPIGHIYTLNGDALPSVTGVLPYRDWSNGDGRVRDIGSAVHSMLYLLNIDDLDETSLDDTLRGYLDAYLDCQAHNSITGIGDYKTGAPHPCNGLQLAAYRELWVNGCAADGTPLKHIVQGYEVKAYHPVYKYAGTIDIINTAGSSNPDLFTVFLKANGKWQITMHSMEHRKNLSIFLSFLTTHNFKKEHNL